MSDSRQNCFKKNIALIGAIALGLAFMGTFLGLGITAFVRSNTLQDESKAAIPPGEDIFNGLLELARQFNCTPKAYPTGSFYNTGYICTGENKFTNERNLYKESNDYLDDVYAPSREKSEQARTLETLGMFSCLPGVLIVSPVLTILTCLLIWLCATLFAKCPVNVNRHRLFEDEASTNALTDASSTVAAGDNVVVDVTPTTTGTDEAESVTNTSGAVAEEGEAPSATLIDQPSSTTGSEPSRGCFGFGARTTG